jgi:hypothetical protein
MPIINNCEIWFCRLDPKRPNDKYNKKNPTWELQIRTYEKAIKKQWEEMHLPVKAIVPDDDSPTFYRVNLRKRSLKKTGEKNGPVKVVNGSLQPIDPTSVGNGSVGNVNIFQYEFTDGDGKRGIASVLMGIQVTKHVVFKAKPRDNLFEETETEVIEAEPFEDTDEEGIIEEEDDDASPIDEDEGKL